MGEGRKTFDEEVKLVVDTMNKAINIITQQLAVPQYVKIEESMGDEMRFDGVKEIGRVMEGVRSLPAHELQGKETKRGLHLLCYTG